MGTHMSTLLRYTKHKVFGRSNFQIPLVDVKETSKEQEEQDQGRNLLQLLTSLCALHRHCQSVESP
jgi:hypothetical protein